MPCRVKPYIFIFFPHEWGMKKLVLQDRRLFALNGARNCRVSYLLIDEKIII
jgi:hypothetical protein